MSGPAGGRAAGGRVVAVASAFVLRRTLALLIALGVGASALTACAERPVLTDETLPGRRCSADGLAVGPIDNDGIPAAVAATRQALIDAAVACDYGELGTRSAADATDLQYESEAFPVRRWRRTERQGTEVLAPLARLLALAPVRVRDGDSVRFTWPSAVDWPSADVAPPGERRELVEAVGRDGIFGWSEAGGYAGWRVTIAPDGRWTRYWYGPVEGEYATVE